MSATWMRSHTLSLPFSNKTTSRDAAIAIKHKAPRQIDQVRQVLEANNGGLTDSEIASLTGLGIRQAGTRRNELVKRGMARDSGAKRLSAAGYEQIVWQACDSEPIRMRSRHADKLQQAIADERERVIKAVADVLELNGMPIETHCRLMLEINRRLLD